MTGEKRERTSMYARKLEGQKQNVQEMKTYALDKFELFLADKKASSINTYRNYLVDLKQFCKVIYGKEMDFVTIEELEQTTSENILEYRNKLREDGMANSSVNRKLNSARSFFAFMEASNPNIRKAIFNVAKKLAENVRGYGVLTWEEVEIMIELAKKTKGGESLSLLIELAAKTCIRLDALLTLTTEEIFLREEHGNKIWTIETIDKGQEHIKPISDTLCEKIQAHVDEEGRIFHFTTHKVGKYMNELVTRMELDPRRNIKFHSLKKAGINFVFEKTGDIMLAQQMGNHKSAITTMKSYMKHKRDLSAMPSYTIGEKIDLSSLEALSKEELLEAIGKLSSGSQLELLRKIEQ